MKVTGILRDNEDLLCILLRNVISHIGAGEESRELFVMLEKRGLLRYGEAMFQNVSNIGFVEALKWLESNGANISECLKRLVYCFDVATFEYLMKEKNYDVLKLIGLIGEDARLFEDCLKMILRLKGPQEVLRIPQPNIFMGYREVEILRTIGYHLTRKHSGFAGFEIYPLMCFDYISVEDFTHEEVQIWKLYKQSNDLKVCKAMMPFMKPKRKEKMKTFIMCIRRLNGKKVPKEIVWKILDYCYSPIEERGSMMI